MGFFRQEHRSGLPFPSPGDLPDPGIKSGSPALQADASPLSHQGSQLRVSSVQSSSVAQSYLILCNPMDCSPPGSSVHGILQASIQEWVAISFSRGSSQPRDLTRVSCIAGRFFLSNFLFGFPAWETKCAHTIISKCGNCC